MKKSELIQIIKEEIRKVIKEYGAESPYYSAPGSFEQMQRAHEPRVQRFSDYEKWKVIALQLGAVIQDRGEDWIAVKPNQDKLGTFSKTNQTGTLIL
jgi:hypothetical protein